MGFKVDVIKDLLIGFFVGVIVTLLGSAFFVYFMGGINLFTEFHVVRQTGITGKVLVIGSLLNLIMFLVFIKKNQDVKARGSILAVLILTVLTQLI